MGTCVEKLPHSCGSRDGLQVFFSDGKHSGYCFACAKYVPDPYYDKPKGYTPKHREKTKEEIQAEIEEISNLPSVALPTRGLTKETVEYFGVKVALSQVDGTTPVVVYFPCEVDGKVTGYKARILEEKKMWSVGDVKATDLFGWQKALESGAKKLYITEGEYDAMALHQALKTKQKGTVWESYNPAVTSVTNGASGAKANIVRGHDKITKSFNEVILVFDKDGPGKKATEDVMLVLPTAKTVDLPGKDANECLLAGKSVALCNAVLFKAVVPKNTRLVWGTALYQSARKPAEWGLSWPWEKLTELTRGIRFGETYYIGGGVKMGKSEVVNAIAKHFMIDHNLPVFLAKPEESNVKTIKMVLGKVAGRIFHDPKIPFDDAAYDAAAEAVGNKLCLLNLYQHLGWDTLKADIVGAVHQGCRAVFIDPITNLVNGVSSGETNTMLQDIAQQIAFMAKDLDVVVFIFCHLKAPTTGEPHERGGKVLSHQFSGSRAMMRSCNYMIGIEGNKDPDLPVEQRNMRKLVLLEDREFGNVGTVRLYWDDKTGLFNEVVEDEE